MENHILNKTFKFKVLVFLAIAVALSLGLYLNERSKCNISLELDDKVINIVSKASTVEELLLKENIVMEKGAYINLSLETRLDDNMNIIIKNPNTYTIVTGKDEFDVKSIHSNVREILNDNEITMEGEDYTIPALDETIAENSKIEIYDVKDIVETKEEAIPHENIVRKNKNLDIGTENVIEKGENGLKEIHISKRYVNGELTEEKVVEEKVINEPVPNVIEKGVRDRVVVTSRGNTDYKKVLTMSASAYDLSFASCGKNPGDKYYGITASGTKARPGAVAVDPNVIPLGTKLYIESLDSRPDYGFATAEDTGGAIKGNRIDLFFHSKSDVSRFGRRKVKVYILN